VLPSQRKTLHEALSRARDEGAPSIHSGEDFFMTAFLEHIPALGSFTNAIAVLLGGILGLSAHSKLPERFSTITFQAIGLFTLFLGIHMATKTQNFLILIFSIVGGSLLGELCDLDGALHRLAEEVKHRIGSRNDKFVEGFVTTSLLFCTGSMAILGAIEEGLGGFPNLLMAKSLLDGIASIALAASLGAGVLLASVPLFLYQGALTLFAGALQSTLSEPLINEVSAVGGLLLLGLGISILEIKAIRVVNMLPSLLLALLLGLLFL
jgi:uncharacterized membrane protein YqgA involved in biofilm formation